MLLTGGLGSPPLGRSYPQNLLCRGLGAAVPQTAAAFWFNTCLTTVHVRSGPAATAQPGFVNLDPGTGALVAPNGPNQIASSNPYEGIHYLTENAFPAFYSRWAQDGDPDYALCTPELNNLYNAKSVEVFLPTGFIPSPIAENRISQYLRAIRALTVYTLIRRNDGPVILELQTEGIANADFIP